MKKKKVRNTVVYSCSRITRWFHVSAPTSDHGRCDVRVFFFFLFFGCVFVVAVRSFLSPHVPPSIALIDSPAMLGKVHDKITR